MILISDFVFSFTNFCVLLTKLLTPGILLPTAVHVEVAAKQLILRLLLSISLLLAL